MPTSKRQGKRTKKYHGEYTAQLLKDRKEHTSDECMLHVLLLVLQDKLPEILYEHVIEQWGGQCAEAKLLRTRQLFVPEMFLNEAGSIGYQGAKGGAR